MKDIIESERLPVVRLNEIFRQAQKSAIIMNAHRINMGEQPILNDKENDFFFMRRSIIDDAVNTIVELAQKRLPNFTGLDNIKDIQVLTPMRKSPLGVLNLNNVLQKVLNPPSKNKEEKEMKNFVFREGDKVMQVKNNYNLSWYIQNNLGQTTDDGLGIFNGEDGIIQNIDNEAETMTVIFDEEKTVNYDFTQLDELELAYAITIHKSQGSEYPVVIIPVYSGPPMLMSRNLLYTAVTRAKKLVVLVGLTETIERMIANNKEVERFTSLSYRIKNYYDFLFPIEE